MLKILVSIARKEEVEPLVNVGADEFYCGLISSQGPLNDRPNDSVHNFGDAVQLCKAVILIHKLGKRVYLALNKPSIDLASAVAQAKVAERIGMDGVIVANLLLIKQLKEMNLNLEINASCLCSVFNSQSVRFYQGLGVQTFHLPRHLGVEDLKMILKTQPDSRLSVFGLCGMCMNVEALCQLHYLKEGYFIPCQNFKAVRILGRKAISREFLNAGINMPKFSCALCALKQLDEMGIYSIKIEGRHATLKRKVTMVLSIKHILLHMEACSNEGLKFLCKKIFRKCFNEACRPEYCYF